MGAETTNRKYPFPLPSDEADVPNDIQRLASAIDADVAALTLDSGWIDINTGNYTATSDGARYRRKAGVVEINLNYTPANYPDEGLLFVLPTGFRPKYLKIAQSRYAGVNTEVAIQPGGRVVVTEPTTSGVAFTATYFID
jgi:hypothetical protein